MYHITTLENGLAVATGAMPHMASVAVGLWVGVGGRHETAELCGVSHFIEHMMFKGTRRRSARRISQDVEGVGGDLNAYTSEENTCYFSKGCHDRFPELLDVMMDMFLNSQFDPGEIEKERSVIKDELAMYTDQPQHYVLELLNEVLWPNQPMGRSLTGTEKSLDAIQRPDLLAHVRRHYVAENSLVTVAGQIDHEEVVQIVKRYVKHLKQGPRSVFVPVSDAQDVPWVRLCTRPIEQTQLALGVRTCSRHDPNRYALRLLNTILGENMSSRLFQVVREDKAMAYSIGSSLGFFDDTGTMTISAGLDTDKIVPSLKLIIKEMRRLTERAISGGELNRARDYLIGQMDLGLESTTNQMMWIGEQLLGYGVILNPATIKDRIAKVTASQVRAAADRFFRPDRLCLSLVSPLKKDRGLVRLLEW